MERLSVSDRERLRSLARLQLEYANSPENEAILKKWRALAEGRRETPTVRLQFANFVGEVITARQVCEGEEARALEYALLHRMVGRELFGDDTPMQATHDIQWDTWVSPFGLEPTLTLTDGLGFHIDPVISDLEAEIDRLRGGNFGVDREKTAQRKAFAEEAIGDILPVRLVQQSLTGAITNPLVHLMSMESYYYAMYDSPEAVHEVMDMATRVFEAYYDFLEKEKLLLPTCDFSPVNQESYAFNCELPTDHVESTSQCWGFLESQETTAVSPEMYGEFVYPYQDRLVRRFGLLSYGCCERVDALWEDYLSKWKNLRKLSVSPFNDERRIGEYLRGTNVTYYSKPRAEFVTNRGPMDETALREYFRGVCEAASGCLFEIAQREVGTIYGDYERGRRYVQIAKECVDAYWRP